MFKYPARTALAVGLSMAQIGEFAFVLLSVASQLGLLPYQVYMLLMGERFCSTQEHLRWVCSRLLAHLRLGPSALWAACLRHLGYHGGFVGQMGHWMRMVA